MHWVARVERIVTLVSGLMVTFGPSSSVLQLLLYIYGKTFFLVSKSLSYLLSILSLYIRLCSPPPVERRVTLGKAPLRRGFYLTYTRNTHRGGILMCFLEVGWFILEHWFVDPMDQVIYFRTLICWSNGSINYTAQTVVRLYVSLKTRSEWRATNLFWVSIKSRTTTAWIQSPQTDAEDSLSTPPLFSPRPWHCQSMWCEVL